MKKLNESDSHAVVCALQAAAKVYAEHEDTMRRAHADNHAATGQKESGFLRMAEQFKFQREQADRLADEAGDHDYVVLAYDSDALTSRGRG